MEFILELAASGASADQIVKAYPQLNVQDASQAMLYASRLLSNEIVVQTRVAG